MNLPYDLYSWKSNLRTSDSKHTAICFLGLWPLPASFVSPEDRFIACQSDRANGQDAIETSIITT